MKALLAAFGRLHDTRGCQDVDAASVDTVQRVINGIKSDPQEGEDGELYAALGYVRKSARVNGQLRRRANQVIKLQQELAPTNAAAPADAPPPADEALKKNQAA